MADNDSNGTNGAEVQDDLQDMEIMGDLQIAVKAQYVKDLSFENPSAPAGLLNISQEPEIDVNVNVEVNKLNNDDYEVVLAIAVDAKSNEQLFLVELSYAGVFEIGATVPEEHHPPILLIECARLLFPFARQIIANATSEGGFQPLMLQPLDFAALYQQHVDQAN